MNRTLLLAAGLAALIGGTAPALAERDGCYGCGPAPVYGYGNGYGYGYDGDWNGNGRADDGGWRYGNAPPDPRWQRPYRHQMLEPDRVADQLRSWNFRRIKHFDRDGDIYRWDAVDPNGRDVRVSVNAWTGQIVDVRRR